MRENKSPGAAKERELHFNEVKGITLIALIVTIIVLLILAGVTIATLTGDNGLLTKAGEAKNASEQANLEEEVQLALIEGQTDKYFNSNSSIEEKLKAIFEKSHGQGNIDVTKAGKNYKVKVKNTKTAYRVKYTGKLEKYEEMDPTDVYGRLSEDETLLYLRASPKEGYEKKTSWQKLYNMTKIIIEEPIAPIFAGNMFYQCTNLEEIENIEMLHTENITNMSGMFSSCNKLKNLDVSKWDTSNVNNMAGLFNRCRELNGLDVSGFDTSKVTKMNSMFIECKNVPILDVSGFDTSNVTDMSSMFNCCSIITNIDVNKFDTSNVTDMKSMFTSCNQLKNLDLSNFDTSKVTNMSNMFNRCRNLSSLEVGNFNTENVIDMTNMFWECQNVEKLDVRKFNTEKVTNMYGMFGWCYKLSELDLNKFDTTKVTNMSKMFEACKSLKNLDLSNKFYLSEGINIDDMFNKFGIIKIKTKQDISTKLKQKFTDFTDENFEIVN